VENPSNVEARPWLRRELIAPWWEIVPVLCVMLGPFAYSAVTTGLHGQNLEFIVKLLNTRGLTRNTAIESGLLAALLFYLRWRGWRPADLGIRIDGIGTVLAFPLGFAAVAANLFAAIVTTVVVLAGTLLFVSPHDLYTWLILNAPKAPPHAPELAWLAIVAGSIVNAYLEEIVFMGYGFHQFAAKRNPLFALLLMVMLRMLLHTYKGAAGVIGIGAFSFVFGLAYIKLRRLWPLILAHILIDIGAMIAFKLILSR
jgi:membrane protease YdiL (CAAX protease family)